MKLKGKKISDGDFSYEFPLDEGINVVGKTACPDNVHKLSYFPDSYLIGTGDCCHGSFAQIAELKNGFRPEIITSIDTNVYDLQPVLMGNEGTHRKLGVIVSGFGCSGSGSRLIDIYNGRVHTLSGSMYYPSMIFPSEKDGKIYLSNFLQNRSLLDKYGAKIDDSQKHSYAGDNREFHVLATYNSEALPRTIEDAGYYVDKSM